MCGFAGFFDDGTGYNRAAALDAMTAAIAHRGPGGAGASDNLRCALGFRRLATSTSKGPASRFSTRTARSCSCSTARSTTTAS